MTDIHVFKVEREIVVERRVPEHITQKYPEVVGPWPPIVLRTGDVLVIEPAPDREEWVMRVTPMDDRATAAYRVAAEDVELLVKTLQALAKKANAPAALGEIGVAASAVTQARKYLEADEEAKRLADAALAAVRALANHVCLRGEVGW